MAIVPVERYPTLQSMMDLFRSMINDDGSGADGPQSGIIATNEASFTLPFLNASIRDLYSDLRNVGDPQLILDNYLVLGLPALSGSDPSLQVSLGFLGYFDGIQMHPQWTLPAGAMGVDRVWERTSGTEAGFDVLACRPNGLAPMAQSGSMRMYEWRGNAMWMPGALESVDLRIRCKISLPDFQGTNLDFTTTYVPLLDCTNGIVDKMLMRYARRFAPDQYGLAASAAAESLAKLLNEGERQRQRQENRRVDFGEEAVGGWGGWVGDL